jgi:oligosaccharide repeat unit polymerase
VLSGSVAAIAAVVAIGFAIFSSSREDVAMPIAASLMIVYYARGRINLTRAAMGIALCSIVLVGITVLRPAKVASDVGEVNPIGVLMEITIGGRYFLDLGKTTQIAYAVPSVVPFQHGRTLVNWAFAPIPRAVWIDKPAVGVGPLLGPKIFKTVGGVPPGIIAELYLNFHFAGLVLGMFVFGVLLRLFYESFRPFLLAGNPNAIAMYAVIVQTCSIDLVNADFSKLVVSLLMQAPPVLLIVMLIARMPKIVPTQSSVAAVGTIADR